VDISQFFLPYGLQPSDVKPSKSGRALRLDEWVALVDLVPLIHQMIPSLARVKPCYEQDDHLGNLATVLVARVILSSRIDCANRCELMTMLSILLCVNILASCMFSLV